MNIIVVGTNWGRVHIAAHTEEGHRIIAIADRNEQKRNTACNECGIPRSAESLHNLRDLKPDVISIAVPAHAHLQTIKDALEFGCPIICEKPVLGISGKKEDYDFLQSLGKNLFFNYAYPYLAGVDKFGECIKSCGESMEGTIECRYNLPLAFNETEWWYETISHQIALFVHLFPDLQAVEFSKENKTLLTRSSKGTFAFKCMQTDEFRGISHHFSVRGNHTAELFGRYVEGNTWHYAPVLFDKTPQNKEEWPAACHWYTANRKSLAAVMHHLAGNLSLEEAMAKGAFDLNKAMKVDQILSHVRF